MEKDTITKFRQKKNEFDASDCVTDWWRIVESLFQKFTSKLFGELEKNGIRDVCFPCPGGWKRVMVKDKRLGPYEMELLLESCKYPSKVIDRHIPEKIRGDISETVKNVRKIIKDIPGIFRKNGEAYIQRRTRNNFVHWLGGKFEPAEIAGEVERFRELFLNKNTSLFIAYLKMLKDMENVK